MKEAHIPGELTEKITASPAARSLLMEMSVAEALERHGWLATQSSYYTDIEEGKVREVDVVGKRSGKVARKLGATDTCVSMVIECKSVKDYHFLFVKFGKDNVVYPLALQGVVWGRPGYRDRVMDAISQLLFDGKEMTQIAEHYDDRFLRFEALDESVMLDPPHAPFQATAFRETNIATERALDNSVLWKSGQTLASAIQSLVAQDFAFEMVAIASGHKTAQIYGHDMVEAVITGIDELNENAFLYHPVVVLDGNLWAIDANGTSRLDWCRVRLFEALGDLGEWWFDVVSIDHLEPYLQLATEHYDRLLAGPDQNSWAAYTPSE